jgi:hypothetical protein
VSVAPETSTIRGRFGTAFQKPYLTPPCHLLSPVFQLAVFKSILSCPDPSNQAILKAFPLLAIAEATYPVLFETIEMPSQVDDY